MKKIVFLLLGIFFSHAISYGKQIPEQLPFVTWYVFPNAIRVIDSNTIWIVANGMRKEIKLYDICSTKIQRKDDLSKKIIENTLVDKRVEIKIYGQNYQQQDLGVLFVDGININKQVATANYVLSGKQCLAAQIAKRERGGSETIYTITDKNGSARRYRVNNYDKLLDETKTVYVKGYYRKDGTYVRSHTRSAPTRSSSGSQGTSSSSSTGRPKTVHVKEYYRKNGTRVRSHMRSAPRR